MESKIVKLIEAGSGMMFARAQGGEREGGNKRCQSNSTKFQLHRMNEFWGLRYSMVATVNNTCVVYLKFAKRIRRKSSQPTHTHTHRGILFNLKMEEILPFAASNLNLEDITK